MSGRASRALADRPKAASIALLRHALALQDMSRSLTPGRGRNGRARRRPGASVHRMRYRKLGKTGLEVSELGYGAWGIGNTGWRGARDDESLRALRRAIELGVTFVDTAAVYGSGHSERLVGQTVREAPGRVYVSTKVPPRNG